MAPVLPIPLEDELGDVLDKAMTCVGMTPEELARRADVPVSLILDAVDYRPEIGSDECRRLAAALGLNEVGLCALAGGQYPLPGAEGLPFRVWPLRMPYGIGVVNAYIVQGAQPGRAVLLDTGPGAAALEAVWPGEIRSLDAIFVTHSEAEHSGGLDWACARFGSPRWYLPSASAGGTGLPMGEGETILAAGLSVTAFRTPGHCVLHNCYHVRSVALPAARSLLATGDLVFAGSAGGPYHCERQLRAHLKRILQAVAGDTVLAPGHGPMTTAANELRYNPFVP